MPELCFPEAEWETFAFPSKDVKELLLELDSYGSAKLDGIFLYILLKLLII